MKLGPLSIYIFFSTYEGMRSTQVLVLLNLTVYQGQCTYHCMAQSYAAHFAFYSQLEFVFIQSFPQTEDVCIIPHAFQAFSFSLFIFSINFSYFFFFLHFPPNIAHPSDVKQRTKPPKWDHPPCNLAKQMMSTRCLSKTLAIDGSRCPWWQLVCPTKCITLMAAKARRDILLSFPFTLCWLLTPEMLVLMGNRR